MKLTCRRCEYSWKYKGTQKHQATCPGCGYKVKIKSINATGRNFILINESFTLDEQKRLTKIKGKATWHDFIMEAAEKYAKGEKEFENH